MIVALCDSVADVGRHVLRIGTPMYRALAAALALAAWPLSAAVDAAAGIALLTAVVAGALAVEARLGTLPLKDDRQVHAAGNGPGLV
jgi:hypothetical protein